MRAKSNFRLTGQRCVISRRDKSYPQALLELHEPPQHLYVVGNPDALRRGLSVVGARHATPYGLACTRCFAGAASRRGITIISGGALGCDAESHRAALDAGGPTVAVLGGGANYLYPAANAPLFQRIVDQGGAVISEYEWDEYPQSYRFRMRNRIIAALGLATLIVEAGLPSGTFSTADEALALGREVMAVPGCITSKGSAGSNHLIFQGATPIVDEEVFDECLARIFGTLKQEGEPVVAAASMEDDPLLASIQANPLRLEEIMTAVSEGHISLKGGDAEVLVRLSKLEAEGLVARFPDGRYGPARI